MDTSVRDLLAGRQRSAGGRHLGSAVLSLLIHAGLAGGFLLVPALAARDSEPIRYNKVQIVPLKALGVPDPAPPSRVEPAKAAPEPAPPPATEKEADEKRAAPTAETRARKPSPTPAAASSAPAAAEPGSGSDRPAQRRGAPDGNPLGLAPFGSNASGFDDPDFQYSYYTDMLLAIIGSNYRRPALAADAEVVVHFRISRNGTIYDAEIIQPSGYASFDQAGLSAVESSSLPNLPVSYPHDSLGVSLIIR